LKNFRKLIYPAYYHRENEKDAKNAKLYATRRLIKHRYMSRLNYSVDILY